MTNTRYIGTINKVEVDRLQAHIGYKVVMITTPDKNGNIQLVGPHYHQQPYGFSADASCTMENSRKHSFLDCTCGFYSYTEIEPTIKHWRNECGGYSNQAIVKVALSQKVVVCENGYRSSHQRALHFLMPHCWNCPNPGTHMVPHQKGYFVPGCDDCITQPVSVKKNGPGKTVRDLSYSFDEFSEKFSPAGFGRIKVSSVSDIGKQAVGILEPEREWKQVQRLIDAIAAKGDMVTLQAISGYSNKVLDELMEQAAGTLSGSINEETV